MRAFYCESQNSSKAVLSGSLINKETYQKYLNIISPETTADLDLTQLLFYTVVFQNHRYERLSLRHRSRTTSRFCWYRISL
jgi:hypothetical protein